MTEHISVEQTATSFLPGHPNLPHAAGVSAQSASENYVEALARVVFYWAYPGVDTFGRTNVWQIMAGQRGTMLGILPGGPKNHTGGLGDYMSPAQRWVVTPNYDTIYGAGFFDLSSEAVIVQTPTDVPDGHYWTIQIVDVMTNVVHQLGSASATPGGKFLMVGPEWAGEVPDGFLGLLRMPTEVGAVLPRSFATQNPEGKQRARAVLNQLGMYPFSENTEGQFDFAYDSYARNAVFPPGVTAEMIAANPSASRPDWVKPQSFWTDLESMLELVTHFGPDDAPMADQARALVALYKSNDNYRGILDRVATAAYTDLHAAANYIQAGLDVGNGWRRQPNGGLWESDWYGRAIAAVIYIFVNDYHEALYLTRGLDSDGQVLSGLEDYTVTFDADDLPPVDASRGGFWSITMYNAEIFMLANPSNGRVNLGTAYLDAGALRIIDGKLTLYLGAAVPEADDARANWLPAPDGSFCLAVRAYVPDESLIGGSYLMPDVIRVKDR
ncbi:DUF1254 domain-containing protein [Subtercola lobariae]|uniref:DUF1254 domain-containing protein n=1 Tax=Subtercola lobariae TaxID=1588641 RepID=A0A917B6R1_9MICO|nr:DUF1254 domain-containing protein [Subtercola lobariae]GGF28007.1 hypothetical protein GCM10011399_21590 [Subtercola lobariae]